MSAICKSALKIVALRAICISINYINGINYLKTTVLSPFCKMRCSTNHLTARASTTHSTSRPMADSVSASIAWSTRSTSCSMIGPSSRSPVTKSALVRLRIRLGALEAGQEGVVDVDRLALQRRAQFRRQDLHIARQHHQVDLVRLHQFNHLGFLRALGLGRRADGQRQVVEGDVVG